MKPQRNRVLMSRTKTRRFFTRRRNGRRGIRGNGRKHTLIYSCSYAIDVSHGERQLLTSHFDIDVSRPCRILSLKIQYSAQKTCGMTFSYTIESAVSDQDATARSAPLMLSTIPRSYTLHNPRSTDFAYISPDLPISELTVYKSEDDTPAKVGTYYLATIVIEFMPAQPKHKDLGVLVPLNSSPFSELTTSPH